MTNLMIVEDNQQILNSYQHYFSTNDNVSVVATALQLYQQKSQISLYWI